MDDRYGSITMDPDTGNYIASRWDGVGRQESKLFPTAAAAGAWVDEWVVGITDRRPKSYVVKTDMGDYTVGLAADGTVSVSVSEGAGDSGLIVSGSAEVLAQKVATVHSDMRKYWRDYANLMNRCPPAFKLETDGRVTGPGMRDRPALPTGGSGTAKWVFDSWNVLTTAGGKVYTVYTLGATTTILDPLGAERFRGTAAELAGELCRTDADLVCATERADKAEEIAERRAGDSSAIAGDFYELKHRIDIARKALDMGQTDDCNNPGCPDLLTPTDTPVVGGRTLREEAALRFAATLLAIPIDDEFWEGMDDGQPADYVADEAAIYADALVARLAEGGGE